MIETKENLLMLNPVSMVDVGRISHPDNLTFSLDMLGYTVCPWIILDIVSNHLTLVQPTLIDRGEIYKSFLNVCNFYLAQSTEIVENTDYISVGDKTPPLTSVLMYDTKPSHGDAPILELWGMWSTPSLPLLPGSF